MSNWRRGTYQENRRGGGRYESRGGRNAGSMFRRGGRQAAGWHGGVGHPAVIGWQMNYGYFSNAYRGAVVAPRYLNVNYNHPFQKQGGGGGGGQVVLPNGQLYREGSAHYTAYENMFGRVRFSNDDVQEVFFLEEHDVVQDTLHRYITCPADRLTTPDLIVEFVREKLVDRDAMVAFTNTLIGFGMQNPLAASRVVSLIVDVNNQVEASELLAMVIVSCNVVAAEHDRVHCGNKLSMQANFYQKFSCFLSTLYAKCEEIGYPTTLDQFLSYILKLLINVGNEFVITSVKEALDLCGKELLRESKDDLTIMFEMMESKVTMWTSTDIKKKYFTMCKNLINWIAQLKEADKNSSDEDEEEKTAEVEISIEM